MFLKWYKITIKNFYFNLSGHCC